MNWRVLRSSDVWAALLIEKEEPTAALKGPKFFIDIYTFLQSRGAPLPETYLLGRRLYLDGGTELLNAQASLWRPKVGIALWPNRPAPRRRTPEDAMDEAADMLQSREPEKTVDVMLRLTGTDEARISAIRSLLGRGAITVIFSGQPFAEWERKTRARFLPTIKDTSYHYEPFYLPQFDRGVLQGVTDEQLTDWMCGAAAYLRESAADAGFLLLCRPEVADFAVLWMQADGFSGPHAIAVEDTLL